MCVCLFFSWLSKVLNVDGKHGCGWESIAFLFYWHNRSASFLHLWAYNVEQGCPNAGQRWGASVSAISTSSYFYCKYLSAFSLSYLVFWSSPIWPNTSVHSMGPAARSILIHLMLYNMFRSWSRLLVSNHYTAFLLLCVEIMCIPKGNGIFLK